MSNLEAPTPAGDDDDSDVLFGVTFEQERDDNDDAEEWTEQENKETVGATGVPVSNFDGYTHAQGASASFFASRST
jgi:hypothetical protein